MMRHALAALAFAAAGLTSLAAAFQAGPLQVDASGSASLAGASLEVDAPGVQLFAEKGFPKSDASSWDMRKASEDGSVKLFERIELSGQLALLSVKAQGLPQGRGVRAELKLPSQIFSGMSLSVGERQLRLLPDAKPFDCGPVAGIDLQAGDSMLKIEGPFNCSFAPESKETPFHSLKLSGTDATSLSAKISLRPFDAKPLFFPQAMNM